MNYARKMKCICYLVLLCVYSVSASVFGSSSYENTTLIYSIRSKSRSSYMLVPAVQFSCRNDEDCTGGSVQIPEMECGDDNLCHCRDSCLVYTYTVHGIRGVYEFRCGECGQLGSECESQEDCSYPGLCSYRDNFCHCPAGEHRGSLCLYFQTHFFGSMLIFGFTIVCLIIVLGCVYQCYIGRHYGGNWAWWQNTQMPYRRRVVSASVRSNKSPAFTSTQSLRPSSSFEQRPTRQQSIITVTSSNSLQFSEKLKAIRQRDSIQRSISQMSQISNRSQSISKCSENGSVLSNNSVKINKLNEKEILIREAIINNVEASTSNRG